MTFSTPEDICPGPLVFARMPTAEEKRSLKDNTDIAIILCDSSVAVTNSEIKVKLASSPLWSNVTHVYRTSLTSADKDKAAFLGNAGEDLHWFDNVTLKQWELAAAALDMERDCSVCPLDTRQCTTECLVSRVGNFPPNSGLLPPSHESYIEIAIALSTGLYGGIHLSPWFSHFPSPAEADLWRWSSVCVAGSGFFASLVMIAQKYHNASASKIREQTLATDVGDPEVEAGELASRKHWYESSSQARHAFKLNLTCTAVILLVCVYIPARCFIIVEAFISLRSLPPEAYETPDWSQWIPHI